MDTKTIKCPKCNYHLTIKGNPGETKKITCPECKTDGVYTFDTITFSNENDGSNSIQVKNLTKKFETLKAVNNASFSIKKGEIFGFLGPNGAGKTTTIKSILGLIHINQGYIEINGINIKKNQKEVKKYVGYLPEKVAFYDNLTALQNMYFYAEMKHVSKSECEPLIIEMGLEDVVNKKVGKFSKGMVQRLGMARALLGTPPILILDEPSGGLDPRGVALIRNKIKEMKEKGSSIFVSSHILAEIQEVCDRVGIINKGVIVAEDTVENLRNILKLKPKLVLELEKISKKIIEAIKVIDGVSNVKEIGVMLHIDCEQKAKSKIIIAIEKAGGNIVNIQTKEPTLEEVFMKFTEEK
jgi:ABC-type multidrug transport system ATPase subunit/phage FluMu protein Com